MKTTVIISKSRDTYTADLVGRFGGGHSGKAGMTSFDAAAMAARYMLRYAQTNPEGGELMAPPEVLEHVPRHLWSIPPTAE